MLSRANVSYEEEARDWRLFENLIGVLSLRRTLQGLRESGSSSTLTRLFSSKHVRDLKLIAGLAAWLMLAGSAVILLGLLLQALEPSSKPPAPTTGTSFTDALSKFALGMGAIIGLGG